MSSREEHQKSYLRFKADESAQAITGSYESLIRKTTTSGNRYTSTVSEMSIVETEEGRTFSCRFSAVLALPRRCAT